MMLLLAIRVIACFSIANMRIDSAVQTNGLDHLENRFEELEERAPAAGMSTNEGSTGLPDELQLDVTQTIV